MVYWIRMFAVAMMIAMTVGCTTTTVTGKGIIKEKTPQEKVDGLVLAASEYMGRGQPQRVKELMRRALEIDPKSAEAYHMLAMAFWQTLEIELADENFKKALHYKPDFTQANFNYASFLYQSGRLDEAKKHMQRVLDDSLYDQRARAFMVNGMILQRMEDYEGAAESYKRSMALDRTNPIAMLGLAASEYVLEDYEQAFRYYKLYRINAQPSPESLLLGIRIADKVGDLDAKSSYELALKNLFPSSPETRQYFGEEPAGQ